MNNTRSTRPPTNHDVVVAAVNFYFLLYVRTLASCLPDEESTHHIHTPYIANAPYPHLAYKQTYISTRRRNEYRYYLGRFLNGRERQQLGLPSRQDARVDIPLAPIRHPPAPDDVRSRRRRRRWW